MACISWSKVLNTTPSPRKKTQKTGFCVVTPKTGQFLLSSLLESNNLLQSTQYLPVIRTQVSKTPPFPALLLRQPHADRNRLVCAYIELQSVQLALKIFFKTKIVDKRF